MNYSNGGQTISVASGGLMPQIPQGAYKAPVATRETVGQMLDRQQEVIGSLHAIISDLEQRLGTALDPTPPSTADAKGAAPSPSSVLHRVMDANRGIEAAHRRIAELTQRINL